MDRYDTPPHYVRALLDVIGHPRGLVFEPCVGRGHITRFMVHASRIVTNDLDRKVEADFHLNAAGDKLWRWNATRPPNGVLRPSWLISNIPFSRATAIVPRAVEHHANVAILTRLSFLEPCKNRRAFWQAHFSTCSPIILPRYSFRNSDLGKRATDNMTCCWLVWQTDLKTGLRLPSQGIVISDRQELKRRA